MNFHDGERLAGILDAAGWEKSASPENADAIIIITCCVRKSAEDRFWGFLNSMKPLKRRNGTLFAVGGCVAQNEGEAVFEKAPHVDLVFGTHQYTHIVELLDESAQHRMCALEMTGLELGGLPAARNERFRAWVPIINGCNNFCTYCVVPYTRGREVSRSRNELLREIDSLVEDGAMEIVLLGQNVNSYFSEGERFPSLLSRVASRWPATRIRFITSHPRDFNDEIIEVMADHPNICRYIHIPLQAGSDRILEAMGRGYDLSSYLGKIDSIRESLPGAAISSDLMVGFPGEEENDFDHTLEASMHCRYDQAYTYIYNPRPGTAATKSDWPEVPHGVKMERFNRLAALIKRLAHESNENDVGKVLEVLVEGESRKTSPSRLKGRTGTNKVVNFEGDQDLVGKTVDVAITGAGPWSLTGSLD